MQGVWAGAEWRLGVCFGDWVGRGGLCGPGLWHGGGLGLTVQGVSESCCED